MASRYMLQVGILRGRVQENVNFMNFYNESDTNLKRELENFKSAYTEILKYLNQITD